MPGESVTPSGLLPCPNPWCASQGSALPAALTLKRSGWRVICGCGVSTFRCETEAEAIAAWNTRPTPAPLASAAPGGVEAIGYQVQLGDGRWSRVLYPLDEAKESVDSPFNTVLAMRPVYLAALAPAAAPEGDKVREALVMAIAEMEAARPDLVKLKYHRRAATLGATCDFGRAALVAPSSAVEAATVERAIRDNIFIIRCGCTSCRIGGVDDAVSAIRALTPAQPAVEAASEVRS